MALTHTDNFSGAQKEAEIEMFYVGALRDVSDGVKQHHIGIDVFTHHLLVETDRRRALGQFYTPSKIAKIAWEMIVKQLGENFWQDGSWRIWDNCAGSGNLEYEIIPQEALLYTYLSTINADEVEFLGENNYFRGKCRGIFQFDYLNGTEKELLQALKDDLQIPNLKWLFFINPPYKEGAGYTLKQKFPGVSGSTVADEMKFQKMGKSANEVTMQFLYKIERDFGKQGYYLALFSKAKWITKPSSERFRKMWQPKFDGGFVLNANEHFTQQRNKEHELKAQGAFPITFSLLNRLKKTSQPSTAVWKEQDWTYKIMDAQARFKSSKTFIVFDKQRLGFREYFFPLNKECNVRVVPVMSGAVVPLKGEKAGTGKVPKNFAGTMVFYQADFQHNNFCTIVSGLAHGGYTLTTANYKSILTGFALFKSVKYDWTRDVDLFYAPYRNLTDTEISDCILYALLCPANNTATTRVNNEVLFNWFNPFDKKKFDFGNLPLSDVARMSFEELLHYCKKIVQWKKLNTSYGVGVWLGLYQYRTSYETVNKSYRKKFGRDYPNRDLCGIPYPDSFKQAIEELRQRVEALAVDLCLTAGKEVTRTRDTFLE